MADEKVLYEVKDRIAWITLNRPESLNAVNRDMVKSIVEFCRRAEEDHYVQIVIFKGNGERAFSVGGDIKDRARQNAVAAEQSESPLVQRQSKYSAIPGTPAPAIAAMNKITMRIFSPIWQDCSNIWTRSHRRLSVIHLAAVCACFMPAHFRTK